MKSYKSFFILIAFFIPFMEIFSLPRFSMLLNDRCSSCHINPTGGEMRNDNGFYFGKNVISMISPRDKEFPLSQKLSDNVSMGFDYRYQILYSQEKKKSDFQDMTGSVYLNASVSKQIDVLARYDFINAIWEGYAIAKILPNDSYIKVGSFIPYYGIRLDDHTSYTRGGDFGLLFSTGQILGLIYNPFYIQTGAELGVNISDFANVTASIGRNKSDALFATSPTFTSRFEITPAINKLNFLLGGSFASAKIRNLGNYNTMQMYGGFAGFGYENFTLMGEYDIAKDYVVQGTKSSAEMVEATYQLMVGLDAVVRYDRFDPNINISNDDHAHLILGFEFFPYSFIEIRPQYRFDIEHPDVANNAFVLQFHFWY